MKKKQDLEKGAKAPLQDRPRLKMKALMEATNTTKATILHYVQKGLLPKPVKTSRNMAFYDPSSITLIKNIKYLQSRYRLPLAAIKEIIKGQNVGRDVIPFVEMREMIFGEQDSSLTGRKQFCARSGLSDEILEKCIEADVLIPKEDGQFDAKDLAIAQILRAGFEAGMPLEDFKYYPRLAKKMVEAEMAIHADLIKGRSFNEAIIITMDLTSNARALRSYIIERTFQRRAASQKIFQKSKLSKKGGRKK